MRATCRSPDEAVPIGPRAPPGRAIWSRTDWSRRRSRRARKASTRATASCPRTRRSPVRSRRRGSSGSAPIRVPSRTWATRNAPRDIASASGVPILPGSARFDGGALDGIEEAAAEVGYPLLVKASRRRRRNRHAPGRRRVLRAQGRGGDRLDGGQGVRRSGHLPRALYRGGRGTSKSRSSASATVTGCTCTNATARCNGASRRWWRSRRPPDCRRRCATTWPEPPSRYAGTSATAARARWSSWSTRSGWTSISSR